MRAYASVADPKLPLARVAAYAQRAERLGFDGLVVPETVNDAMLTSLLALEHTERLHVMTGVVVALARSPMVLAQNAWALAELSGGRFTLGVGPQVKGNIEKRYGMKWSAPAARMRDYVGALRAILACWRDGGELDFQSENYTLTRMQPFFRPDPMPHATPIAMAAIGPLMTRVAGALADAVIAHPTNSTPTYLSEVTRARLEEGSAGAGRPARSVHIVANPMIATGKTDAAVAAERDAAREVLTFTYSTPAYWPSLEHHGFGDLGPALRDKTRAGDWAGMQGLIGDEILDLMVPSAGYDRIAGAIQAAYAGVADAICLRMPADPADDDAFAAVIAELKETP